MSKTALANQLFDINSRPIQAPRCLLLVTFGVLLLSISAHISFMLPFTPVPITGQTFAVLLIGLTYGRRLGANTILTYLALGSIGLPVFASGVGLPLLFPSGGYLIGYFFATLICGYLAERGWTESIVRLAITLLLALFAIYACGVLQLSLFVKGDLSYLLHIGVIPFLPAALFKAVLIVLSLPITWKIIGKK